MSVVGYGGVVDRLREGGFGVSSLVRLYDREGRCGGVRGVFVDEGGYAFEVLAYSAGALGVRGGDDYVRLRRGVAWVQRVVRGEHLVPALMVRRFLSLLRGVFRMGAVLMVWVL